MITARFLSGTIVAVAMSVVVAGWATTGCIAQGAQAGQTGAAPNAGQGSTEPRRGEADQGRRPTVPVTSSGSAAARFPRNAEEFDQMFNQIKNWGRWGPDDQLGAANLITEAKRKQAFTLAKLGRVVGLAHPLLTEPAVDNESPFEHTMMDWGFTNDSGFGASGDTYKVSYHGTAHSHLDGLC